MLAITLAVVSAGLIACLAQMTLGEIDWEHFQLDHAVEPVLLLTIIVCSTGFWTLQARSVVGGILLATAAQFVLYLLLVLFVTLVNRMAPVKPGETNLVHTPEVHAALSWFVCGFGLSYPVVMLWLSRKKCAKQAFAVQQGAAANGGIASLLQSPRLVAAVAELGSLGIGSHYGSITRQNQWEG